LEPVRLSVTYQTERAGLIHLKGNRFDGSVVPISGTCRRHKEHPVKDHLGLLARVQYSAESPHGYLLVLPLVRFLLIEYMVPKGALRILEEVAKDKEKKKKNRKEEEDEKQNNSGTGTAPMPTVVPWTRFST
jgi:hypothetical protein